MVRSDPRQSGRLVPVTMDRDKILAVDDAGQNDPGDMEDDQDQDEIGQGLV